jgi:multimeric flavodoxin WrbA
MKVLILAGSPRRKGNTNSLVKVFTDEAGKAAESSNVDIVCEVVNLYDLHIEPCVACRKCQADWNAPNCTISDDLQGRAGAHMPGLFEKILEADLIITATPIYSWYCTAPMKSLLDRCVYALNKYYGDERGPSLWAEKRLAAIVTCGYPQEKGADIFEEGLMRYCMHSQLKYKGMLVERHMGYNIEFMDEEKEGHVREFARELILP